jgi:hypothetical protein
VLDEFHIAGRDQERAQVLMLREASSRSRRAPGKHPRPLEGPTPLGVEVAKQAMQVGGRTERVGLSTDGFREAMVRLLPV